MTRSVKASARTPQAQGLAGAAAAAAVAVTTAPSKSCRAASTHAVTACAQAVDLVHAAAGATGFRDEAFHRHFRDIHVVTQHAFTGMDGSWLRARISRRCGPKRSRSGLSSRPAQNE